IREMSKTHRDPIPVEFTPRPARRAGRRSSVKRKGVKEGLLGVLLSMGLTTGVYAQISNTIYSCVNNASGEIPIVDPNTECHQNWHLVIWNVAGPQGPAGPAGPQ